MCCVKDRVGNPDAILAKDGPRVTIYSENFDSSLSLPSGWTASPSSGGWKPAATNPSTGYTNASGINNLDISNATGTVGDFSVTSKEIVTTNLKNISVTFAARNSSNFSSTGSSITGFAYSVNGGSTWTDLSYSQNPGDSNWYLVNNSVPITLSSDADNKASVMFRWSAHLESAASGSYRIDDFQVTGTQIL